jgi:protein-disulfide isomerase
MTKQNVSEPRSNTPLLIIGLVLVVALLGGWWFYSTSASKPTTPTANTNSNDATGIKPKSALNVPANAPPGAQPAHEQGSPNAVVTIEEFADYQCPQCALAHPIMNEIKAMYGTRIRFIFREYPLDIKAHDKSYDAAVAAEAAGLQGKFWEMQNMLFANQQAWTDNSNYKQMWRDYAQRIGLDVTKWENDIIGMAARGRVEEDKKRGKALGITGTPTIFLNGASLDLPDIGVAPLKRLIDAELQKSGPSQGAAPGAANNAKRGADNANAGGRN